jgi:cyclophilin family peptidyl-prolyl cis-trans isomerase
MVTAMGNVTKDVFDLQTTDGTITIELFPGDAPNHVKDFVKSVNSGGFDGASFYFVSDGAVAAGNERNVDVQQEPNRLASMRGMVTGCYRANGTDGSGYINFPRLSAASRLPLRTVFGRVIAGMDVVDRIAQSPVDANKRPLKPITITHAVERKRD